MTVPRSSRAGKFNAKRTKADGYSFDSLAEYARYVALKLLSRSNAIYDLRVHPVYALEVSGRRICNYEADFSYREWHDLATSSSVRNVLVVEDVKGFATPEYKIKRELFRALYPDADFRELNTDKSSTRKAWTKFAATRGAVQTQGAK